jgi:hypothetical protein
MRIFISRAINAVNRHRSELMMKELNSSIPLNNIFVWNITNTAYFTHTF